MRKSKRPRHASRGDAAEDGAGDRYHFFVGDAAAVATCKDRENDADLLGAIARFNGFASPSMCKKIIELAENAGFNADDSKIMQNQDGDDTGTYRQATTDVEVDKAPSLKGYLQKCGFSFQISKAMSTSHGKSPVAFDDVFVVKYDASNGAQRDLLRHVDAGDVSFMLALSPRQSYRGGGTKFDARNDVVHLDQGSLLVFDAGLFHSGVAITSGKRYLLVGFSFTDVRALRVRGNLDLSLNSLRGTSFPFGVYDADVDIGTLSRAAAKHSEESKGSSFINIFSSDEKELSVIESFAKSIFCYHAKILHLEVDAQTAAAEYWVQNCDEDEFIPFHQDLDEKCWKDMRVAVHPAVATVTYLSQGGFPTVVSFGKEKLYSFPEPGKHIAFEGSLTHGVPEIPSCRSKGHRLTLLVNVWPKGLSDSPRAPRKGTPTLPHFQFEMNPIPHQEVEEFSVQHAEKIYSTILAKS